MNWTYFWEQYDFSVYSKKQLTNTKKLAYLKNALKGGAAKHVIDSLTGSGDHYEEAISLRLSHLAHVLAIVDATPLKDGTERELHYLHYTVIQHLRALWGIDCKPSGPFVTSVSELNLDMVRQPLNGKRPAKTPSLYLTTLSYSNSSTCVLSLLRQSARVN